MADAALVGPNAVIRLAEALRTRAGEAVTQRLFRDIGRSAWLVAPPSRMLAAAEVARLHRAVRETFSAPTAAAVFADAGRRTGDYLLAHRIPAAARWLLPRLPRRLATRVLLAALRRNAWTFGAKGRFSATVGARPTLAIAGNPLCPQPGDAAGDTCVCAWHEAVFETLFQALVSPEARVQEVACLARGDRECRFEVSFGPAATASGRQRDSPPDAPSPSWPSAAMWDGLGLEPHKTGSRVMLHSLVWTDKPSVPASFA